MNHFSRHSRAYYITGGFLAFLIILLISGRLYLNIWLPDYVNNVLNNIEGYQGSVESINIDLYRGAYRINKLVLNKKNGNIPTPFIAIHTTDLSIQWSSLIHGRIVSDITLTGPVINFAVNKDSKQTGKDVDWTKPIKDLMPIDINTVKFNEGKLTYQDFASNPKVNIYIHHMQGEVRNLRNVVNASEPLPSTLYVTGDSIGNGHLEIKGKMNILKDVPDMDLLAQLENVNLPALNNYSNAYADFDFKSGDFSLYSEFIVKNENVSGYIKPIARHIAIIDLRKTSNPIKLVWESIVATVITLFTNHTHDQFATKINLEGRLDNINTDTWSAIGGILHNAFISALKRGLDKDDKSEPVLHSPSKRTVQ
jgi:hypothetical protein